jgi:hypothetical protein
MAVLNTPVVRRLVTTALLAPVVLLGMAAPASAAPPETWPETDSVSALDMLLILVAIPVGLIAVISLLVYVPSMVRGQKYTPGLAWRSENEWFGGPRGGVEAATESDPAAIEAGDSGRGGASARW